MASSGGKAPYQYHTNASTMNGNGRVAIIHQPSQIKHSGSAHHSVENIENDETVVVASEEKKYEPMVIKVRLTDCENDTNDTTDDVEKSASKNKTAMCLINELVRSNKVSCDAAILR